MGSEMCIRDSCKQALLTLINHHDGLRCRFSQTSSDSELPSTAWRQHYYPLWSEQALSSVFQVIDLSSMTHSEQIDAMQSHMAQRQAGLQLSTGPLMQIVLFERGDNKPKALFWTIHHLIVDAVSWRILSEDFTQAYENIYAGQAADLPPKTSAFSQWLQALQASANDSEWANQQRSYWQSVDHCLLYTSPSPRDLSTSRMPSSA